MQEKTCSHCSKTKSLDDFHFIKRSQTHDGRCKLCVSAYMRFRRQNVPGVVEAEAVSAARWRAKEREAGRAVGVWAGKTPEQKRAAYEAVLRWRARNPERARSEQDQSQRLKRSLAYRKAWPLIMSHYGGACLSCGSQRKVCFDHVAPISLGGPNALTNGQPLCNKCNTMKGATIRDRDFRPDQGAWIKELVRLNPWLATLGGSRGQHLSCKGKGELEALKRSSLATLVVPESGEDCGRRVGSDSVCGPCKQLDAQQLRNKCILDSLLANLPKS